MATRCNITFTGKGHADAGVFRFVNGDPDEVLADLGRFFGEVEAVNAVAAQRPGDSRFGHPEYLAARYLIWQTWRWAAEDHADPLTVIGLGVPAEDSDMIAWSYEVACDDPAQWPQVSYRHPGYRTRFTCDAGTLRSKAGDAPIRAWARNPVPPGFVVVSAADADDLVKRRQDDAAREAAGRDSDTDARAYELLNGNRDDIVAALAEASCRYPSALSVNICPDCAVTDANVWFLEIACELAGAGQLCDEHTADTKQAMRYAELEHILRSMP
jgi:hypothetical protein